MAVDDGTRVAHRRRASVTARAEGKPRPYDPGEDMQKYREGVVVCQGPGNRGRRGICARPTKKVGRYRIAGGWHDVYECDGLKPHRFGVKRSGDGIQMGREVEVVALGGSTVVDVATAKPTFGGELPF